MRFLTDQISYVINLINISDESCCWEFSSGVGTTCFNYLVLWRRRYMAEILPGRRKIPSNKSIIVLSRPGFDQWTVCETKSKFKCDIPYWLNPNWRATKMRKNRNTIAFIVIPQRWNSSFAKIIITKDLFMSF